MKNLKFFTFLLLFLLVSIIFYFLSNIWIGADASIYLSYARDIADGKVLYRDIPCTYTPLVIYINSFLFNMFNFQYLYYILFQYLIIFLSSFILFKLSLHFKNDLNNSILTCLLYLLSVFSSDGIDFILEPYLLLFCILAVYLLYKQNYLWSGILIGLCFLSKQYGLVYFPILLILIYLDRALSLKIFIQFTSGFIIPQLLFLLILNLYFDISIGNLLTQLSGKLYYFDGSTFEVGLLEYVIGGKVLFSLIILYFIIFKFNKNSIPFLLMIILSLTPTLIKTYQHYFLISFPVFYLMWVKSELRELFMTNKLIFLFIIILNSYLLVNRITNYKYKREEQIFNSHEALKTYPRGSEVLIEGEIVYLYFLNNYKNPLYKKHGYRFIYKISEAEKDKFKRLEIN
jgi:hypothetical protein